MNVLWITNILFPEASSKLGGINELKSSGGWMLGSANNLIKYDNIKLYVATVSPLVKNMQCITGNQIVYYILPYGKGNLKPNRHYQEFWLKIKSDVNPDVVHIHGTEYSHGFEYIRACGADNVVISIQGMKSAYYSYYFCGISIMEIYRNITIRDIFKGSIIKGCRDFKRSSNYEIDMLNMVQHIIGRTSWDRARTWAINPNAQYHLCNETLRDEFYDQSLWNYEKCQKYTIFLSQAGYPIKGLHQLLKAMPLIIKYYPDTLIRIAGSDITRCNSIKDILHYTGYGRYVKSLIRNLNLQDKVMFIGNLNADDMKKEYLNCNVFVCPSSIENSPNSLGEAQILGVPCIASYVGGIPDMMVGCEDNLYRFNEIEMLAEKIIKIFNLKGNVDNSFMQKKALLRHNPGKNVVQLVNIYREIVKNN